MIQTTLVVIISDCVISYLQKRCFLFFKTVGFFIIIVCFSLFIECHRPQGAQIAAAHRCCQLLPAGRGGRTLASRTPCPPRGGCSTLPVPTTAARRADSAAEPRPQRRGAGAGMEPAGRAATAC